MNDYRPSAWTRIALIAAGTSASFPRMPCTECPTAGRRKRPGRNTSDRGRWLRCITLCFMSLETSTWTGIPPAALPTAMVWRGSVMSGGDVRVLERERGDLRGGGGGLPEGPRLILVPVSGPLGGRGSGWWWGGGGGSCWQDETGERKL